MLEVFCFFSGVFFSLARWCLDSNNSWTPKSIPSSLQQTHTHTLSTTLPCSQALHTLQDHHLFNYILIACRRYIKTKKKIKEFLLSFLCSHSVFVCLKHIFIIHLLQNEAYYVMDGKCNSLQIRWNCFIFVSKKEILFKKTCKTLLSCRFDLM